MQITWIDFSNGYEVLIVEETSFIQASITRKTKTDPFIFTCEALNIYNKEICNDSFFSKRKITNDDEKVKLAKEETIKIIKRTLKTRKETYEKILKEDMDNILTWKDPERNILAVYPFYFYHGKRKIHGSFAYKYKTTSSFLILKWMDIGIFIEEEDINNLKEKVYKAIRDTCYGHLEILRKL